MIGCYVTLRLNQKGLLVLTFTLVVSLPEREEPSVLGIMELLLDCRTAIIRLMTLQTLDTSPVLMPFMLKLTH
jgi:hypothetical protein